jgi:hypothetical protein
MSTVNNGPQIVRSGLVLDLDASYMRSYSPNVHPKPIDIFDWCQNAGVNACSVSRDASMTRQYGSIPLKMAVSGNDPYIASYAAPTWNLAPAANGQTWTVSVYVKASVATTGELFIFGADIDGYYGGVGTYGASGAINITTSWTRVSFTTTMSGANVAFIQVRLDGPNAGGSGQTIWWDGLQVERASSATQFNPYYFGNTVWKDVSSNGNDSVLVNTGSQNYFSTNAGYIAFDGTNDYVSISGLNTNTRLQNNYQTLSFFVYITSVGPNAVAFLYAVGANANGVSVGWLADSVRFFISSGASNLNYPVNMTNALNTWMNITCIVDNINRTMTVYKNGSLVGTSTQWSAFTPPNSVVTIGNNSMTGNTGDYIKGRIANVLVYNRALSAAEISQNYEADKTRFGL